MAKLKLAQRVRIIRGNVCFYATVREIRAGVGDFEQFNSAVRAALDDIVRHNIVGVADTYDGIALQLNLV